ncbi:MAG: tetratricopeptide repeat protein [Bryobacteraceae bacterium]
MAKIFKSRLLLGLTALAGIAILTLSGCANPAEKEAKFLESGKRMLARQDYQRAVIQFRNAVQAMPRDPEAFYQLALAYLGHGSYVEAVQALRQASSLDPKHVPTQLKLAELMTSSHNREVLEEAQKHVEGVLSDIPDNPEALTTLALTKLRLGQPAGAEDELVRSLAVAPTSLRSSLLLAKLKLSQKDAAGAEQVMLEAAQKSPQSVNTLIAMGEFYLALRRYPQAETQLQKALQLDSKSGLALIDLGALQMASGRKDLAEQTYRRVSSLPGGGYRTSHVLFLLHEGQADAAIAELKGLMDKNPRDREIRSLLVGVYMSRNEIPKANQVLSRVLEDNPKDIDALMGRARVELMAGQYAEAQKDLLPVLGLQPGLVSAHHMLAKVYQAQGAEGLYRQELEEALRRDPQYLGARLELASALLNEKAPQAALDLINQTPNAQQNNALVMVQRNAALMGLDRRDEAARGVEAGLKIARSPELLMQDAVLKLQRRDFASARKSAEEALSLAPDNVRALDVLMGVYRAQGQAAEALKRAQEYAGQHPMSSAVQQYVAMVLASSGKPSDARAALAVAKAANPNSIGSDLDIARMDLAENKTNEARGILSALLARDSENSAAGMLMAEVEIKSGNPAGAIDQYRRILKKTPRSSAALNNLAYLLADRNEQLDEALKDAQQAKELSPDDGGIDDTIGWVHYRKGLYPTAVRYFEASAAKRPTATGKYHLAMAYLKMGDRRRGTETLNQALKLDPTLPEAAIAKRALADLAKGQTAK